MPACVQIEGRGPVATALSLFLLDEGFSAHELIMDPPQSELPQWLASRAIALSQGSLELLSQLIPALHPARLASGSPIAAPIDSVVIMRAGRLGRSLIEAEPGAPACLGAVMRYEHLQGLLSEALKHRLQDTLPQPDASEALRAASAIIGVRADGDPRSAEIREFDQHALIAEVMVSGGRPGRAWERFTHEGPLALLPLPGFEGKRRALVWCAPAGIAQRRCEMEESLFNRELLDAFGPSLGSIRVAGPRFAGPIRRQIQAARIDSLTVAIGNAAQTLHPVAGQGLNLGLRDARVLARCLGDARARLCPGGSVPPSAGNTGSVAGGARVEAADPSGWIAALDRYGRLREIDRRALVGITDSLASLPRAQALAPIQSVGLASIELCPPAKRLARRIFTHGFRRL